MAQITIQSFVDERWRNAATIDIADEAKGTRSASRVAYEMEYWLELAPVEDLAPTDIRALSVALPVDLETRTYDNWPAFLLDLMPQGHVRRTLAELLRLDPDAAASELPLLLRTAGSPIGNLRVREAWESERQRLAGVTRHGVRLEQVFSLDDYFLDLARQFASVASGSFGIQGTWPKMLLTQAKDGLWYPDPFVDDDEARQHAIIKWAAGRESAERLILAAEAPYLEVARAFGLRCAKPLQYQDNALFIPRFDRYVGRGSVVRLGQESIVSAAGVAQFGHLAAHEDYLDVIKRSCSDPATEVVEYVLRDVLNLAMGNSDNHGRNTALQKLPDGSIRLTPLFDFAPMRLDPSMIPRSTTWACMRTHDTGSDVRPDWKTVCEVAARDVMNPDDLKVRLASKAGMLAKLPDLAGSLGVDGEVIFRALARAPEIAEDIAKLAGCQHAAP